MFWRKNDFFIRVWYIEKLFKLQETYFKLLRGFITSIGI